MQDRGFNSFASNMIKLSVSFLVGPALLFFIFQFEYLISNPKIYPGLSRNGSLDPKNNNQEAHTRLGKIRECTPPLPPLATREIVPFLFLRFTISTHWGWKKKKENNMIKANFFAKKNVLEFNSFFWQCNKPRGLIRRHFFLLNSLICDDLRTK